MNLTITNVWKRDMNESEKKVTISMVFNIRKTYMGYVINNYVFSS